ncbi:E3 ubiquitin-ligase UPL3-like isoform A [Micractinium conductrix]|uniref:HECT-type E3 ubiquitin transferase n=1 Tax=Micractinium conductrix TaxID=554055 RepID=A0A2P6V865_9CHLO|nr:E3 ubiquitin-ligase UPL3-like isoform A [Micractinium conductrix]|eukprot:PSC70280.1 E3 ubiquitin-ligase UPL3-like isoform A [Micractinium conductrix]
MTRGSPKNKRGAPQPPEERPATKRGRRGDPASPPSRPRSGGQAAGEQARSTRAGSRDKELVEASQEPERLLRQQKRAAKQPKQAVCEQQQRRASAEEQAAAAVAAAAAGANMERRQSGGGGRQSGQQDDDEGNRAQSTLQGLLRRLGAGFEDILPPGVMGGGQRVRAILAQLRDEDEMAQLGGMTELCEYLSISTEDNLVAFPTEQVVPLLVNFLGYEHNPDLMLLAARALTFLADVFPPAAASIIRHGAVPAFCARLLTIEYIDLAEQSLQALEKLSHDHPGSLLRNGALVAVLSYVDFFQTGVQRVAVATAANMCRGLSAGDGTHADAATAAAPILIGLLQYQDAKIVDSACLALTRTAEAFACSPRHLEALCGLGLITSIVQMVGVSETGSMTSQLQVSTFYGLLKILSTMAAGSHVVAEALLQADISGTLRNLLATSSLLPTTAASPGNVLRSTEQLGDLIGLAAALLPPIPEAAAAMLADVPPSPSFAEGEAAEPAAAAAAGSEACQRARFLADNPGLLQKFSADLLPLMIRVYSSSVTPQVKRQCLTTLAKMLLFSSPATLAALLEDQPASSLVAALLNARDATVVAFGMQMAETLMEKLPDVFRQYFLKEGVVHATEQLAALPLPASAEAAAGGAAAAGMDGEEVSAPPRGRRLSSGRPASHAGDKDGGERGGPAAVGTRTPGGDTLRSAVGTRARRFNARYFTDAQGHTVGCETEVVRLLRDICSKLPDSAAVDTLLGALSGAGAGAAAISTFELLSSGAVAALRRYLQGEDLPDGAERQQLLLARLGEFAATAVPPGSGSDPPLRTLVGKLLAALAASEKFPVQLNPITAPPPLGAMYGGAYYRATGGALPRSTSGVNSLAAGLAALSNPFKIRLACAGDEPGLRDYSTNMVLIEPLASMSQIEDFLWPRVMGGAGSGAGAAAAATAAAGDDPRSRAAAAGRSAAGAAEPSVNLAARATAAAMAAQEAAAAVAEAAAAAAAAAAGGSRPGSGGRRSKGQPIPQRRLTRAQARLAAQAEVVGQGNGGEEAGSAAAAAQAAAAAAAAAAAEAAAEAARMRHAALEEELLMGGGGVMGDEEDYSDEDMEDGGYVEGEDEEYDEDEEDELGMAAHVHDMHLGEGPAPSGEGAAAATAAALPAAAPSSSAPGSSRGAAAAAAAANAAAAAADAAAAQQTYAQATGQQQQLGGSAGAAAGGLPQPVPHLAFYVGGRLLPAGTTVFQAVQQQLAAAGGGAGASTSTGAAAGAPAGGSDLSRQLWGEVHTISYRSWGASMQLQQNEAATSVVSPRAAGVAGRLRSSGAGSEFDSRAHDHDDASRSPLAELLEAALPADVVASQDTLDVLAVLRVADSVNRLSPHLAAWLEGRAGRVRGRGVPPPGHLPRDAFLSAKLAPKLNQQLKDVLSICGGALPPWCGQLVHSARFLFPFDARRCFFYCTAFGLPRALHYLQHAHAAEHGPASAADREAAGSLRIGRVQRQKVRISRRRLLDSAFKVFELYAGAKSQLEIEFFNEVGTGLGPTLEFYTLLSHELQRKSLGIWRHDGSSGGGAGGASALVEEAKQEAAAEAAADAAGAGGAAAAAAQAARAAAPGPLAGELDEGGGGGHSEGVRASELVCAPHGLFPAPLPPGQRGDESKPVALFRLLGRAVAKALQDGRLLDLPLSPVLYRLALQRHVDLYDIRKFDAALGSSLERLHAAYHAHAAAGGRGPLLVDGCPLDDLCLTFELPGQPAYPLHPEGAEVPVTAANLRQYLDAVVEATLGGGVQAQVSAFRAGFEAIFPVDNLAAFYEDEIEAMLCGTGEAWSPSFLAEVIKVDHGYTLQSPPVRALLEVLSELDAVEQRRFLRFVTGTPRLPPGGLAALQPRLTVVRKHSHSGGASGLSGVEGASAPQGSLSVPSGDAGSLPPGVKSAADGDLPSVMTCANYIKLPPYSSKEVLKERLLFAITEGQGSFDLS